MKKTLLVLIAITLISAISIVLFSYLTGSPSYPKSVVQTTIHSKILNEDREIIIHLPRYYDKNKDYPVIYVLDGSSQDKHIANKFDILSTAGYIPETIVVGLPNVSGKGRQRDYTPPYMRMDIDEKNSPLGKADYFLSFMEKELFPYIEKNYSVSKIRLLAGNSRGGLLVIYSLLYKPDLFAGRFCFSPALWRDDNLIVKKTSDFLAENQNLNSFLYLSIGGEENDKMKSGYTEMIETLNHEQNKQLVWHSDITKNADHQNNAEISASIAIRKWFDFLKATE
ncbi:alpha/beta hydrolase [Sphingobacterium sp. CZ-2]|uniref:alpha/beta hydrolase n=1 Tax=Sphingobacterium sp. CZ-2 TaxID=2557994 RepID=UPI00106F4039|nr:alpha/beta hydrolase-fold protein [Sphingobacterium sp. CZ-2]QBR12778.1 alpha/beta hydrolase [Sphingobacterium sp. CZ-2]